MPGAIVATFLAAALHEAGASDPPLLARADLRQGVRVDASDGERSVAFTLPAAAFALAADESIHPALASGFRATLRTTLLVERAGNYRFHIVVNGGRARLAVGNPRAGSAWAVLEADGAAGAPVPEPELSFSDPGATPEDSAADGLRVGLAAGELPFTVEFERARDPATGGEPALPRIDPALPRVAPALLRVEWSSDSFAREPLPPRLIRIPAEQDDGELAAARSIERGRLLAEERGCFHCHRLEGEAGAAAVARSRRAPDLTRAGARTNAAWIERWLADPRALRPRAAMPALPLSPEDRRDVAGYLATLDASAAGASTARDAPPSIATADELDAGRRAFADVGCIACHDPDASDLGDLSAKTSEPALAAFLLDPLAVDPSGRMPALFTRSGELARRDAATARAIARWIRGSFRNGVDSVGPPAPPSFPVAATDPAPAPSPDLARGQDVVRYAGCLSCHELRLGDPRTGVALVDESFARPFAALGPDRGCLAATGPSLAPDFSFTADERADLRAFVAFAREHPDRSAAPAFELSRSLERFGCVSCHASFDGGPRRELAESPPPLTVAGAKMRSSWLEGVLAGDTRVRPWLHLRMPTFGDENVRPLVRELASAAGVDVGEGLPERTSTREERLAGVRALGAEGGLACIGCHDFRDYEAIGSRGPDLTRMHARLRPEWYELWMRQPLRLIPGTSMPRYFDGATEAETREGIARIWSGLQAGEAMPPPPGLVARAEDTGRAQPARRPLLQRTFMPESSPASIALALPGMVNGCFDTVECRVRYAWDGDFLDMRPQWAFKGEKLPRLLGPIFWRTSSEFGVRVGAPELAGPPRFRGHRRRDGMPELYYDVLVADAAAAPIAVRVDERVAALERELGLVHRFRVGACSAPVYFVARDTRGGAISVARVEGVGRSTPLTPLADGVWKVAERGPVELEIVIVAEPPR